MIMKYLKCAVCICIFHFLPIEENWSIGWKLGCIGERKKPWSGHSCFNHTYSRPADKGCLYSKGQRNASLKCRDSSQRSLLVCHFNFFSSFVSLSLFLSLLLSPSIILCRTPCTMSGRREKKKEEKWVRATYFFPTVHGGRGWWCYRWLDE